MVYGAAWALLAAVVLCTAESSAQQTRLDWKVHDVGRVRQVITNAGALNAVADGLFTFPGLLNCENPPNSRQEHIADGGIWIGAVLGNDSATVDTFVSVTEGEGSPKEFFPGPEPSDSIWVVSRGDTVDIPYWPGYVGVSDQDFVCKYTDYGPVSLRVDAHTPLYLEVIQTSYAWSSPPLDEFIVLNYYITSTRLNLEQVYLTS